MFAYNSSSASVGVMYPMGSSRWRLLNQVERVSDLLCMSNSVHASLTKEYEDNDDYEGSIGRAAERG